MHSRICTLICIATVMLLSPLLEAQVTKTEYFDQDPNWESLNNRTAKPKSIEQDFGPDGTGKIGGAITIAAEPAYYAKKIPQKTFDDVLTASGTLLCPDGNASALIGFFNAETLNEWRTRNTIAIRINGRGSVFHVYVEYDTQRWRAGGSSPAAPESNAAKGAMTEFAIKKAHPWTLKYDPAGNNGGGSITVKIDDQTAVCNLVAGHKLDGATFNRFGLLNIVKHAADKGTVWLSDLAINGEKQDLASSDGWEGHQNRRRYETSDVRPFCDYGLASCPTGSMGTAR